MPEDTRQTVIEDGTEFDGKMNSRCGVTLSGRLRGELSAPSLTVTPSGFVDGRVKVSELKSRGEVSGQIEAESVELAGRVNDETVIRANTLEVQLNQPQSGLQVTFGNCELQIGETAGRRGGEVTAKVGESSKEKPAATL